MKRLSATSALMLVTCVCLEFFASRHLLQAQDNPTPPPLDLPIVGTAAPTPTITLTPAPDAVQIASFLPTLGLQPGDVPQFTRITTTETALNLDDSMIVLTGRYPAQSALIPSLNAFYSSAGISGTHETRLLAEDCTGLSLYGVGSWLRVMPAVSDASILVDNATAFDLYNNIFGWTREGDNRGLPGVLYMVPAPSEVCSIPGTIYILDYSYGAVTVTISVYAPTTTSPDVVVGTFPSLIERINGRIAAATGFTGSIAEIVPTLTPSPTVLKALEVEVVNDYDVLPNGDSINITRYEIDTERDVVRVYFEANYGDSLDGSYLQSAVASEQFYPIDEFYEQSGATDIGWFEFNAFPFETLATLALVYAGTGDFAVPVTDIRPYFNDQFPNAVTTLNTDSFDTYSGGFLITVYRIDIVPDRDVVRLHFDATASQTTLRSPVGTYLQTNSGQFFPLAENWTSPGLTYYSGWFEFDARPFRNESGLRLIYCGNCNFYDIGLPDIRGNF